MSVMDRGMMTGARKAAILLSLLGEDAAAPLCRTCRTRICSG